MLLCLPMTMKPRKKKALRTDGSKDPSNVYPEPDHRKDHGKPAVAGRVEEQGVHPYPTREVDDRGFRRQGSESERARARGTERERVRDRERQRERRRGGGNREYLLGGGVPDEARVVAPDGAVQESPDKGRMVLGAGHEKAGERRRIGL